ncbi:MAG: hypothetical protein WC247_16200 [Porticoccaceae bacterium]|jgi:hypothetical protein
MKLQAPFCSALAFAALTTAGQSALASPPDLHVSGFGTLGYVTTDTNEAEFRSSARQHKGATDSSGDWGVDSRLGLQANVTFNSVFSAVGQVFASRRDKDYSPDVEWLFGQANLNEWASVRVGRMVLPTFLVSDSRHVGYAMHWLRVPMEAYASYIPTSFDGVQGIFRAELAGYNITTQLSAGQSEAKLYSVREQTVLSGTTEGDEMVSLNLVAERGDWTLRAGYTLSRNHEVQFPGSPAVKGDDGFTGLGVKYDNGSLLVQSEYILRRWNGRGAQDGYFDSDAYYLSAGYRFGAVMPYATFSHFRPDGEGYSTGDRRNAQTTAIGVRWDAVRNLALKAQVEEARGFSGLQYVPVAAGFAARAPSTHIFSIAADFVF